VSSEHKAVPGDVWDNDAMEGFFLKLKTERVDRKIYGTRDEARVMCSTVGRFYNPKRQH
jgi:putative transposase